MPADWKVVTGDDLWKVVSRPVVEKANEDSEGGTEGSNDFNTGLDSRASEAVRMAVDEVRHAVELGNRIPVSETVGSVPPEAERLTLFLAAFTLLAYPPSLMQVLVFDGGIMSPLQKQHDLAQKWIDSVRKGAAVTMPTDPAAGYKPNIKWGDAAGTSDAETAGKIDMTTDGPWNTSETA